MWIVSRDYLSIVSLKAQDGTSYLSINCRDQRLISGQLNSRSLWGRPPLSHLYDLLDEPWPCNSPSRAGTRLREPKSIQSFAPRAMLALRQRFAAAVICPNAFDVKSTRSIASTASRGGWGGLASRGLLHKAGRSRITSLLGMQMGHQRKSHKQKAKRLQHRRSSRIQCSPLRARTSRRTRKSRKLQRQRVHLQCLWLRSLLRSQWTTISPPHLTTPSTP